MGGRAAGTTTNEEVDGLERAVWPGAGTCAGMFTANTMAAAIKAMGLTVHKRSLGPAGTSDRRALAVEIGRLAVEVLERVRRGGPRPWGQGGHRLVLDSPERVSRAAVLDIMPTSHVFASMNER